MELFIELDWTKWYLVVKWIGCPVVNAMLQILWRLTIIQWLLAWDFDLNLKLLRHTAEYNHIYVEVGGHTYIKRLDIFILLFYLTQGTPMNGYFWIFTMLKSWTVWYWNQVMTITIDFTISLHNKDFN